MKKSIKKFMLWSHRWLGITIGVHLVLLGLSGSYLVYTEEIDSLFKPHLKNASAAAQTVDLEKIIQATQQGLEVEGLPARMQIADPGSGYNHKVTYNIPKGDQRRRFITAYVDSATFEFKGSENFRETLGGFLFIFHHDLFSGPTGRTLTALTGVLSLFLFLGGLYLWWPLKGKSWRRALKYNKQRSFLGTNLELHKFFGFYSLLLMCIVTFSGIYLARPDWFFARNPGMGGGPRGAGDPTQKAQLISLKDLQQNLAPLLRENKIAQLRFDSQDAKLSALAADKDGPVSGWEWSLTSGALNKIKMTSEKTFKDKFSDLQRAWHVGGFWGELGRLLVFISGLLPLLFYFTGFYYWWKRS